MKFLKKLFNSGTATTIAERPGPRILASGDKVWRNKQEQFNREDGPAIEFSNRDKFWLRHGKLHRDDGHAVESVMGNLWYRDDQLLTAEEIARFSKNVTTDITARPREINLRFKL
jgi:hypothetical protein